MDTTLQSKKRPVFNGYTVFSAKLELLDFAENMEKNNFFDIAGITIEDVVSECQTTADIITHILIHDKLKFYICLHASGKFSTIAINRYAYGSLEECYNLLVEELGDGSDKLEGFIVLLVLVGGGSYQPIFSTDDGLMFFVTEAEAQEEINSTIADVLEAIKQGNMDKDSEYTADDYKIIPAILNDNMIYCELDGDKYEMQRTDDDWKKVN